MIFFGTGRTAVYITFNRREPNAEPCGTPAVTVLCLGPSPISYQTVFSTGNFRGAYSSNNHSDRWSLYSMISCIFPTMSIRQIGQYADCLFHRAGKTLSTIPAETSLINQLELILAYGLYWKQNPNRELHYHRFSSKFPHLLYSLRPLSEENEHRHYIEKKMRAGELWCSPPDLFHNNLVRYSPKALVHLSAKFFKAFLHQHQQSA